MDQRRIQTLSGVWDGEGFHANRTGIGIFARGGSPTETRRAGSGETTGEGVGGLVGNWRCGRSPAARCELRQNACGHQRNQPLQRLLSLSGWTTYISPGRGVVRPGPMVTVRGGTEGGPRWEGGQRRKRVDEGGKRMAEDGMESCRGDSGDTQGGQQMDATTILHRHEIWIYSI